MNGGSDGFDLVGNPDIANGDYDIHWLEKYLAEKDAAEGAANA